MKQPNQIRIAAILPFWRFAVVPASGHSPGVPFWSESEAFSFFNEAMTTLPWASCYLVQEPWWGREFKVVAHYQGIKPRK
jgi:hypothetical protein